MPWVKDTVEWEIGDTLYLSVPFTWLLPEACRAAERHGLTDIGCYVLIGFRDTPQDARYRLDKIRELGYWPNPMRYQPLDTLDKDSYVSPDWTECELKKMRRYYSKLRWFEHIPYDDFDYQSDPADGRLWQ